jgi:hypothetical protein
VFFGLDCPLCGATRATQAVLGGRWVDALDQNLVSTTVILPAIAALSLLYAWCAYTGKPPPWPAVRAKLGPLANPAVAAIGLAVFTIIRNLQLVGLGWLHSGLQL